jgi:predicted branched-subunit amino acid permease
MSVTVVLSVAFAALFFPIVREQYRTTMSVVLTALGVAVIWIVYFIRAAIFSRIGRSKP